MVAYMIKFKKYSTKLQVYHEFSLIFFLSLRNVLSSSGY